MENLETTIAQNLVLLRKKSGLKQSDVASKLKYSDKTISKWETGEVVPSVSNLYALCELYGVTLDEITKPIDQSNIKPVGRNFNKLAISLLAISVVWVIATVMFVYVQILSGTSPWTVFVWSVPISCIVGIVFNTLWGNRKFNYAIVSVLIWSIIACFYLQFLQYNLVALFFIGIPAQVSVILWAGITTKRHRKNKHEN